VPQGQCLRVQLTSPVQRGSYQQSFQSALGHRCCNSAGFHVDACTRNWYSICRSWTNTNLSLTHPLTHQLSHRICTDLKIYPREGWGQLPPLAPPRGDATGYVMNGRLKATLHYMYYNSRRQLMKLFVYMQFSAASDDSLIYRHVYHGRGNDLLMFVCIC